MQNNQYALITAVKNEERFIGGSLQSVISQTMRPLIWVIVDDNSSDATAEIIREESDNHAFIRLVRRSVSLTRDFGSKALALQDAISAIPFDEVGYIGCLDGDITFGASFYQDLITHLEQESSLGIAGGLIHERKHRAWVPAHLNPQWCVGGATQLFRSTLFRKIGGYPPLRYGGEDTVVEYIARAHGFSVKAFEDCPAYHHKPTGPDQGNGIRKSFRYGLQEYFWGTAPIFEVAKALNRVRHRPVVIGAIARIVGYCWGMIKSPPQVPPEIVKIVRAQQHQRLKERIKTS